MIYQILKGIFSWFFLLFFRAEAQGRENMPEQGAVILAANHMSNWDPPLLAAFLQRPVTYMAKQELFEIPVFGAAIRACHAFPVKRGAADRGAIKAALRVSSEMLQRHATHPSEDLALYDDVRKCIVGREPEAAAEAMTRTDCS